MKYDLTSEGMKLREKLADEAQHSIHTTNRQLEDMRRLWILDQYLNGRTEPMTGPVMGPLFHMLIHKGSIREV